MNDSTSRRVRDRGAVPFPGRSRRTAPFPGRSTPAVRQGFSRPLPAQGDPDRRSSKARRRPESRTRARDPLLLELHALDRDCDRADSYLCRPGCNVLLGLAHLSRTMAKRSRILGFLRDDRQLVDPFRAPADAPWRWATRSAPMASPRAASRSRPPKPPRPLLLGDASSGKMPLRHRRLAKRVCHGANRGDLVA